MKESELKKALINLFVGKTGHVPDEAVLNVYFDELKGKKGALNAIELAKTKTWYRDRDRVISRMPEVSELLSLCKENPSGYEPPKITKVESERVKLWVQFTCDCMKRYMIDPRAISELVTNGQIKISKSYLKHRDPKMIIDGEIFDSLPRSASYKAAGGLLSGITR